MPPMSESERKVYLKTKIDVVVTRSCRGKETEESKISDFKVGQTVSMAHLFADELISMGKAVVKGSPDHKIWEEWKKSQPEKVNHAEQLAAANEEIAQLKKQLKKAEK